MSETWHLGQVRSWGICRSNVAMPGESIACALHNGGTAHAAVHVLGWRCAPVLEVIWACSQSSSTRATPKDGPLLQSVPIAPLSQYLLTVVMCFCRWCKTSRVCALRAEAAEENPGRWLGTHSVPRVVHCAPRPLGRHCNGGASSSKHFGIGEAALYTWGVVNRSVGKVHASASGAPGWTPDGGPRDPAGTAGSCRRLCVWWVSWRGPCAAPPLSGVTRNIAAVVLSFS